MASNQEEDEVWRQSGCCFVKLPGNLRKSIFCYFPGLVNKNASKYRYDNKALPSNEKDQSNEINNPTRNVNSYTQNINYCHESASPITNSDICYMEVEVVYCIMLFYVRFASQPDGSAWPGKYFYTFLRQSSAALPWSGDHGGWVCSTYPMEGTLTYDCLPEVSPTLTPASPSPQPDWLQVEAPAWFKTAIPGPARGPHMREPGCNGAVCYCNDGDFCNCKGSLCSGAALGSPTNHLQLVLAILCSSLRCLWIINSLINTTSLPHRPR